ncbi:MAG: hypothetical protein ABSH32_16445 [Bryobacteraceae bacterium]|jgi:hypothetical protein
MRKATHRLLGNLLAIQMVEGRHELGQIDTMFLRKAVFPKSKARIQRLAVMQPSVRIQTRGNPGFYWDPAAAGTASC